MARKNRNYNSGGYLVCKKCEGYYELNKGEDPGNFESCQCGGELEFTKKLDFKPETTENKNASPKKIQSSYGKFKSIIIGVIGSVVMGFMFGIIGLMSVPFIQYLPLILAGILTMYLYNGDEYAGLKYAIFAGVIAALANFFGNVFIFMGMDYYFYYAYSNSILGNVGIFTSSTLILSIIMGGFLGFIGGLIGIFLKNNILTSKTPKNNYYKENIGKNEFKTSKSNVQEKWEEIWQEKLEQNNKDRVNSSKKIQKKL